LQRLVLAGLLIVLLGVALIVVGTSTAGGASTGGAIFIGPFPIVFGSGPGGASLALLSVVIGVAMLVLVLIWGRRVFGYGAT